MSKIFSLDSSVIMYVIFQLCFSMIFVCPSGFMEEMLSA